MMPVTKVPSWLPLLGYDYLAGTPRLIPTVTKVTILYTIYRPIFLSTEPHVYTCHICEKVATLVTIPFNPQTAGYLSGTQLLVTEWEPLVTESLAARGGNDTVLRVSSDKHLHKFINSSLMRTPLLKKQDVYFDKEKVA